MPFRTNSEIPPHTLTSETKLSGSVETEYYGKHCFWQEVSNDLFAFSNN